MRFYALSICFAFLSVVPLPGANAADSDKQTIADTFREAKADAKRFGDILRETAIPKVFQEAPENLVEAAKANLANGKVTNHGKMSSGDNVAYAETQEGAFSKVDSHEFGFLELFADKGQQRMDWRELYLFGGQNPSVLSAVSYRRLEKKGLGGKKDKIRVHEAYIVPGTSETWLVFEHSARVKKSLHAHHGKRHFLNALTRAGFKVFHTGPQQGISGAIGSQESCIRRLLKQRKDVRVIRGKVSK